MKKSYIFSDFLVKNGAIDEEKLRIILKIQKKEAEEMGLMVQLKKILDPDEILKIEELQEEKANAIEAEALEMGVLTAEELEELEDRINESFGRNSP